MHPDVEVVWGHYLQRPVQISGRLVELFDRFGNRVERGGSRVDARALGPSAGQCIVDDRKDGTYEVSFTAMAIGDYKVRTRSDSAFLGGGEETSTPPPSSFGLARSRLLSLACFVPAGGGAPRKQG